MSHKHSNNPFKKHDFDDIKTDEQVKEEDKEVKAEEPAAEEQVSDNSELEKLKDDFDKLNNQYLRLAADFDNYRKRQEQEREALLKFGTENALKKLIEVIDNFERGAKALESVEDCQKVIILFINRLLMFLQNSVLKKLKQKEKNLILIFMRQ